ncbi:MAG: HTTM domain-containing protein [Bacteroidota bacterium]
MKAPKIHDFLHRQVSIAPLVVLRIVFGSLMLFSMIRYAQKSWIEALYVLPTYHFSFLSWLKPAEESGMYVVFIIMGFNALCIILGLFYRVNVVSLLILFVYTELLDKTYYLNHYYLVSLLLFWMCIVPAHRSYSIDRFIFPAIRSERCANWCILIFKVQLSIVYFFAGLAKVNPDWLLQGQPLATWLPGKYQLPILGSLMHYKMTALIFSWAGCIYDLTIWIFLLISRTRGIAYIAVLGFHILTGILFPRIGMFPYIMMTTTIIFFSETWHQRVLSYLPFYTKMPAQSAKSVIATTSRPIASSLLIVYVIVQLLLPLRYLQYDGNLFWHEQGYRFSWRVMLMEKNGYTAILVKDPKKGTQKEIRQEDYLTPFQRQQMKSQPDMIYQFAQHVGDEFSKTNGYHPEIYVKSRLSLNGRRSQPFTDETMNIYQLTDPMRKGWILPLKER